MVIKKYEPDLESLSKLFIDETRNEEQALEFVQNMDKKTKRDLIEYLLYHTSHRHDWFETKRKNALDNLHSTILFDNFSECIQIFWLEINYFLFKVVIPKVGCYHFKEVFILRLHVADPRRNTGMSYIYNSYYGTPIFIHK